MVDVKHTLSAADVFATLHRHPRVSYQGLTEGSRELEQLELTFPPLVAFGKASYHGALAIIDWDHRLPSRIALLRVYAYYSESALQLGRKQVDQRSAEIRAKDRYPEFDVPDYSGLSADEAYEGEVALDGTIERLRLISPWRRDVGTSEGRTSLRVTRESEQFQKLVIETREKRPDYLGDLEAVAWTPPCETAFSRWTIDVWYLMHLDATVGRGQSFLVDLEKECVVGMREFVVRAG